jgi:SAM-dependent methyltransferase
MNGRRSASVGSSLRSLAQAVGRNSLGRDSNPGQFFRQWARFPLVYGAGSAIEALPQLQPQDVILGPAVEMSLASSAADLRDWSLGVTERLVINAMIRDRGIRDVFEIGTFNGGTTRMMAEAIPADGRVVTLDLPPYAFDATQAPHEFIGAQVGSAFKGSDVEPRITQLLADSKTFDPTPYAGQFDLVLVDGAHDYEHGIVDSRTALRLVRPGGVILWDDFEPYWWGLVHAIIETLSGHHLARLSGTSLAIHLAPTPEGSASKPMTVEDL